MTALKKSYFSSSTLFLSLTLTATALIRANAQSADAIEWDEASVLPPPTGELIQPGLAGPFAGVHEDALIIAGGANFPQGFPWDGGPKIWWKNIFILEKQSSDAGSSYEWADEQGALPKAAAYGTSIQLEDGLLCIGGCDAQRCFDDVNLVEWNSATRSISITEFPALPKPLAFMAGAKVGDWIVVAGGQETMNAAVGTKNVFGLDLSKRNAGADTFEWVELPSWDGSERVLPVAAAHDNKFYLFSGRSPHPDKPTKVLTDAHQFDVASKKWSKLSDTPVCLMAGTAAPAPSGNGILIIGGADGVLMGVLEHNGRKARSKSREESAAFGKFNIALLNNHPGFSRSILHYDPATDAWTEAGVFPAACPVTTPAVSWGSSIFLPSGEVRPGVRDGRIWKGTLVKKAVDAPDSIQ